MNTENISFKSSKQTVLFKYFFPFLFLIGFISAISANSILGKTPDGFPQAFLIITIWLSIFLVQVPFRLKNVTALNDGIIIKGLDKKIIPYQDIISVSMFDLAGPWFVTIQYEEKSSLQRKKICFIPSSSDKRIMADDEMTKFIKNKMQIENPSNYELNQKSSIKNFFIMMLLGAPFAILAFYFLSSSWL